MEPKGEAEFEFITELFAVVAQQTELQPILDWLARECTRRVGADECTIRLLRPEDGSTKTVIRDRRDRDLEAGAANWSFALKSSVMGYLLHASGELATPDITNDVRFPGFRGQPSAVRALLAVALKVDGRVTGMMTVSNASPGRVWSKHDLQLLSILASQSAGVIERVRLRGESQAKARLEQEKHALDKELLVARDIQMSLVPPKPLTAGRWQMEGRLVPARQVGGDFYDYFAVDDRRVVLVLADVAGKGVPAALLVSTVQSALRAFAEAAMGPLQVVEQLNRTVLRSAAAGKFVTLFYGELDHAARRLRYVNAGHLHPRLRRSDGGLETLSTGGMPLGLFDSTAFGLGETSFGEGDSLLIISDGIPDAENSSRDELGEERVDALWRDEGGLASTRFLDRLMDMVRAHRGEATQTDDETALVMSPRGKT